MKTDAERMALIRQRTTQLQRQAHARQMLLIDAGCMAACLVLVVCLGVLSFLLGSCVTILLYRLRRSSEKKHTRDDDEL